MSLYKLKVAVCAANIFGLSMSFSTTTLAQTPRNGQASTTSPAEAKKQWAEVPPLVRQCVNAMLYREKGEAKVDVNLDTAIRVGKSPTDAAMEPLVNACRTLMPVEQKTNFPCTVPNSKGQQVATTCEESFVKWVNGQQVPISREDILLAARNREKVKLGVVESYEGGIARRADERRAFEASPEGQRQAAERAVALRKEEEARRAAEIRRAAEFPYYAVITCGVGYRFIPIASCLSDDVDTTIEVRNGRDYGNYNLARVVNNQIPNSRQTTEGLFIDLRPNFSVKMQNASSDFILGMKIYRRQTNSIVYNKEAQRFSIVAFGM